MLQGVVDMLNFSVQEPQPAGSQRSEEETDGHAFFRPFRVAGEIMNGVVPVRLFFCTPEDEFETLYRGTGVISFPSLLH